MRAIVGLFLFMVVCLIAFLFMQKKMNEEPGPVILVAFGESKGGEMEVNICIPLTMRKAEYTNDGGTPRLLTPDEWTNKHWELRSRSGDVRPLSTMGNSLLVSDTKAGGAPDFWVKTSAKVGESYRLIYIPDVDEGKKFKFEFDAKAGIDPRQRVEFELMD